jgi:hypothetical protein
MRCFPVLVLLSIFAALPVAAEAAHFQCRGAILGAGKPGEERLEYFGDGHGHEVELWCVRGIFSAHFDLRIGWIEQPSGVRRTRTIAGCFFDDGRNSGPDMVRDTNGAYSRVEWINRSPPSKQTTYRFSYDYSADKVSITVETPCHAPISKIVAPQENIDRLEALLPDPPRGACPSDPPGG